MATNYRQIYAIKAENEKKILRVCPDAKRESGIYCFYRINEQGFKFAYVGLATKSVLTRLAEHLSGYNQHIDLSIRKYGLYDEETNPFGYKITVLCYCPEEECNEKEQYYIKQYADEGWQLRNVTGGSQGEGKFNLAEGKSPKGYREGLEKGYQNARKDVAKLFDKNLTYSINGKPGKRNQAAYEKFTEFLNVNGPDEEDEI
jgi:hypothetical protein